MLQLNTTLAVVWVRDHFICGRDTEIGIDVSGRISTMWRETTAQDAGAQLIDGIERGQFYLHLPRRFTNSMRLARRLPYRLYVWLIHKMTG